MPTTHEIPTLSEIAQLKQRLLILPDALYKARLALADAQQAAASYKEELAQVEAEILLMVMGKIRPDGKLTFSNEAMRAAEVRRRLAADPKAIALADRLQVLERERAQSALDVQRLEDEQRVWRAHVDLTVAEVQLLCAGR